MSISPNDIRIGSVFRKSGRVLKVVDKQHVKLSKGGACQQVKCVDLESGSTMEMRLNVTEQLEEVYISKKVLTYSYTDGDTVHFMNSDCEMIEFTKDDLMSIASIFDNDGSANFDPVPKVEVEYFQDQKGNDRILNVKLVDDIVLKITDTRPSIKGEAAKSGHKPATAEGGIKIKVPPHVNIGDYVVLSKVDLSYISKK